jgi:hypothetical protein
MSDNVKIYYHFTGKTLRNGDPIPKIGEWLIHDGLIEMCSSGLHASPTAWAALQYAPGELLHKVELDGIAETHEGDKAVASKRRIVATIDATDIMRRFARTVALGVIHLWNPPAVVVEYLNTGDESNRAAAWAAARDAAWDAAWAAAGAAAGDAAWAAAWAAARDAAGGAAWDAAWAAAGAAAGDAAGAAAGAAAGDAARAAAGDAAWAAAGIKFNELVNHEFDARGRR